jgi:uncharacterized membrane protein
MNILDIFFAPSKYFAALKEKPKWLIPLIIIVVASIIVTIVVMLSFSPEKRMEQLRERNLTPEQMEQAQKMMSGPIPMISGIVASIIITPVIFLLLALIFNFTLPLLAVSGKYMTTFCIVVGAGLVTIVQMLVRMILVLVKSTANVHTSFALFVPMLNKSTYFYRLLAKLDFFTIWQMALLALGLKLVYEIPSKKSYYLVFGLWLLFVIITSFFGPGVKTSI